MKVLVDANVLLRVAQPNHPQRPAAHSAIVQLIRTLHEPCIVPQTIYEFWGVATRPADVNGLAMNVWDAEKSLDEIVLQFRLLRDERGVYEHWRSLLATHHPTGKPAHDARLVAAMLRHGVSHLLTFNVKDFQRYSEITVLSVEAVAAGQPPV